MIKCAPQVYWLCARSQVRQVKIYMCRVNDISGLSGKLFSVGPWETILIANYSSPLVGYGKTSRMPPFCGGIEPIRLTQQPISWCPVRFWAGAFRSRPLEIFRSSFRTSFPFPTPANPVDRIKFSRNQLACQEESIKFYSLKTSWLKRRFYINNSRATTNSFSYVNIW